MAVGFGVTVVAFLGLAGLATEAGSWYSAHRKGQNAADAAATAAAMVKANSYSVDIAKSAGWDTATKNGFRNSDGTNTCATTGTIMVCINHPPTSGSHQVAGYFEALISQVQTPTFARIFGITSKTVTTRAVAGVADSGVACVLSLDNKLWLNGNFTLTAPNCMIASNDTSADSIDIGGSTIVNVQSMHAEGGCQGCDYDPAHPTRVLAGTPYAAYSTETPNPFVGLDSVTWPTYSGTACASVPNSGGTTVALQPTSTTGIAYCSDLHMQNTDVYTMVPGTYVFYDSNVQINGGTLTCPTCSLGNAALGIPAQGVSIILLGDGTHGGVGDLNIDASATVILNAGPNTTSILNGGTTTTVNALAGVLFYRQNYTNDLGNSNEVTINGGGSTVLTGGFYFPKADAIYAGNSSSTCTIIVGGSIQMTGTATLSEAGCANIGTQTSSVKSVVLVE